MIHKIGYLLSNLYKYFYIKKVKVFNSILFHFSIQFENGLWKYIKISNHFLFFENNNDTPVILEYECNIDEAKKAILIEGFKKTHSKFQIGKYDFYLVSKIFEEINVLEYYWKFFDRDKLITFSYSFSKKLSEDLIDFQYEKILSVLKTIK